MTLLRICGWNVHECVGADRRRNPGRVASVLREIDADVVALQEVHGDESRGGQHDQPSYLSAATGLRAVAGPTLERGGGRYGNLVLTRLAVREVRRHDLSVPGREPRGAIVVSLAAASTARLRVAATHLGLAGAERAWQTRHLLDELAEVPGETLVVLGDWNEWAPWGRALQTTRARFGAHPSPATFPSRRPLLALDRIWVSPRQRLVETRVHRSPDARLASDHLPVVATLALPPAPS